MAKKRAGRMTAIPQLDVPDIFVDDEEGRARGVLQRSTMAAPPTASSNRSSDLINTPDAMRPLHKSWSSSVDISSYDSAPAHPLSFPRSSPSMPGHQAPSSAVSFEVQEPGSSSAENAGRQRGVSDVNPSQVRGLLDDSVWVESIRRSATIRKSVRKTDWNSYR